METYSLDLLGGDGPSCGIARCWGDNSEPSLMEVLDDVVVCTMMARDGVTRRYILGLVARFRSAEGRL